MDKVRVLVKAIIIKNGKLLALKRPKEAYSRPNAWDLPGGNLDFGEEANAAIERELNEETSLKIKNLRPFHVISKLDEKKEVFWIEICYLCDYDMGEVKLSSEHTEYKWVTKDEFLKLESADYLMEFVRHIS
jgi:ADP-ribose pyrophosphatase YjhB (NUDIX family)